VTTRAEASLAAAGFQTVTIRMKASESAKTLATVEHLLVSIAAAKLDRFDPVIVLGGGVVGDTGGLAAALYRRGVDVYQVPTTLLSMVDASVGGKTAVNLTVPGAGLLKNMIGAFWQPRAVLADVGLLETLSPREFRAGLAECVKHAMLGADFGDDGLLEFMQSKVKEISDRKTPALRELVLRNVAIKAKVVASDPLELAPDNTGGRALLNLGHTFAHAIETISTLSPTVSLADAPLKHGEAVALGLVAVSHTSDHLGLFPAAQVKSIAGLLESLGLPVKVDGLPPQAELMQRMRHDKKVIADHLRLIVPVAGNHARVMRDVPEDAIARGWDAIRI
jgi:3-dehydroquinate synthase